MWLRELARQVIGVGRAEGMTQADDRQCAAETVMISEFMGADPLGCRMEKASQSGTSVYTHGLLEGEKIQVCDSSLEREEAASPDAIIADYKVYSTRFPE